jgi:hypothetical protein
MQTYPKQAFDRARPIARGRPAPRPLVLGPESADMPPPPLAEPGGWLEAALAAETRVMTPSGPRAAGLLRVGDAVLTLDAGAQPVRWIGRHVLSAAQIAARPELGPIDVAAHALGGGAPRQAIRVSPRAGLCLDLPDAPEGGVLVEAGLCLGLPGLRRAPAAGVTYVQLLLDRHGLIAADGLTVETLHPARLRPSRADRGVWSAVLGVRPELEHGCDLYGPAVRPRAEPLPG